MVAPGTSSSGSLPVAGRSATSQRSPTAKVKPSSPSNGASPVADLSAMPEEPPDDGAESSSSTELPLHITDLAAMPDEPPPDDGAESSSSTELPLHITDLAAIPDEPPDDILFHHKAGLIQSAKLVWEHREIIHTLAERDFRAQYKQTALGLLWAVLTPVATLLVLIVIFSRIHSFHTQGVPFALYAFVGIICWTFFSTSLGNGGNSLLVNKALLSKTQFPRECFPLETMVVNGVNSTLSLVPLTLLFVYFGRAPAIATLWVPLFVLIEIVFAAGVTLGAAGLIIQARDLTMVLPLVISLGIFATPVIWPFTLIPTHVHVAGGHLVRGIAGGHHWIGGIYVNLQVVYGFFNPIGPVINSIRATMLLGHAPSWPPLIAAAIGSIFYLFFGYKLFKRFEVDFADIA